MWYVAPMSGAYDYRLAESEEDFRRLWELNHRIFAEELGQHTPQPGGALRDPYAGTSRYLLAWAGDDLAGMIALNSTPPFSVEKRLSHPKILEGLPQPLLEIRLLAVDAPHRNRMAIAGLLAAAYHHAASSGTGTLLISGITDRVALYERLGFRALGPAASDGRAAFVPMALRLSEVSAAAQVDLVRYQRRQR